jgi:hypothetical protein
LIGNMMMMMMMLRGLPSSAKLHSRNTSASSRFAGMPLVPAHDGVMLLSGAGVVLLSGAGLALLSGAGLALLSGCGLVLLSGSGLVLLSGSGPIAMAVTNGAGVVVAGLLFWASAAVAAAAAATAALPAAALEVAQNVDPELELLLGGVNVNPSPVVHDGGRFNVSPALIARQPGLAAQMACRSLAGFSQHEKEISYTVSPSCTT